MKRIKEFTMSLVYPAVLLLLLAGCQNMDEYRKERIAKADNAFKEIKSKKLPEGAVLSLPYCIETALGNNLNMRVYDLKVAVQSERRTAAALGMLPDVIVTNDLSNRNNQPGASSYSLLSGQESLEPSQSSEKWENRVRVEFLFSFIDFGLAYFNAVQEKDRVIITEEERRRAAQNLILDVSRAYFKVAAAQYAMENTEKMLKISVETEAFLEDMVKSRKLPLEKIIIEKKTFLVLKKSLMEYKRSYENSCIELRSLMGYYPKNDIVVDTSGMKQLAELKIPDVELLEEIALLERPELYQLDIQQHITAISARKKIIEMFPNVGIFTDFTNSTNKYLYNQSWWELGIRAAYRLLRVPQQVGEFVAIESEIDQIQAQVTALSVGILSQVRIAHANLVEVKNRYAVAEELFDTYKSHEVIKEKQAATAGSLSMIELNRIKMETAQKDIERTEALGNYYLAYFRLLNSVGIETLDTQTIENIKERINENFKNSKEAEYERSAVYSESASEYQQEIDSLNKKIEELGVKVSASEQSVNSSVSEIGKLQNELKSREESLLRESESKLSSLNMELAEYNRQLEQNRESLVSNENTYRAKISQAEEQYQSRVSAQKAQNPGDEAALEQIENEYSMNKDNAEKDFNEIKDSLESKISDYENKAEEVTEQIDDEKDSVTDRIADLKEDYEDRIADISGTNEDSASDLESLKKEIASYTEEIKGLENKKAEALEHLEESSAIINEHGDKLAKYVEAIELLDSTNNSSKTQKSSGSDNSFRAVPALAPPDQSGEHAAPPDAVTPDDNLNMQAQEQATADGGVNFLEYDPEATRGINMQTQANSGDNDITLMGYQPDTQKDIQMQTMSDAGNNEINFQEYGSQLETGDDSVGNASQNNQVDQQLGKSLTE